MAGGAHAASDDQLTCERCHGFYAVEPPSGTNDTPRLRCNSCGHMKELAEAPVKKLDEEGKWTVIGPDGKVMTFGSWDELAHSQRPSQVVAAAAAAKKSESETVKDNEKTEEKKDKAEEKKDPAAPAAATDLAKTAIQGGTSNVSVPSPTISAKPSHVPSSASALLDITPTPVMPKLALTESDSDPNVGDLVAKAKKAMKEASGDAAPPSSKKGPDSIEELDSAAIMEDYSDEEPAPLSLRDAEFISDAPDPADDSHEMLSLKDLVVVPAVVSGGGDASSDAAVDSSDLEVDSTPPPPPRGRLHTLAPTPSKQGAVAPPPTISWDEPPPSKDGKEKAAAAAAAKVDKSRPPPTNKDKDAKAKEKETAAAATDSKKKSAAATTAKSSTSKDSSPPSQRGERGERGERAKEKKGTSVPASARAAVAAADEPPKRGWIVPSIAIVAVSIVIWRVMIAPGKNDNPTPPIPTTPATTTTTAPNPTESTTIPTPDPSASVSTTPSAAPSDSVAMITTPPTASSGRRIAKPGPDTPGTAEPPEKPTGTKPPTGGGGGGESMSELLDKAGAARRSGDYPTAKTLYERILASSPSNVEANGGLGDVSRATGDLASAKTHYERALAASPAYGPAQLGLADVEWDMGNRAGAQRRYAEILSRLGDRAPERVKQRGAANE